MMLIEILPSQGLNHNSYSFLHGDFVEEHPFFLLYMDLQYLCLCIQMHYMIKIFFICHTQSCEPKTVSKCESSSFYEWDHG